MLLPTNIHKVFAPLLLVVILLTSGCAGYQLAADEQGIFGDGSSTLRLKSVENPTMHLWLPQTLRSHFRDEIAQRKLATWVDSGNADYTMRLKIDKFSIRSSVRDSDDNTLIYSANLSVEAFVYNGSTNSLVWRSERISLSRTFENLSEEQAGEQVADYLTRQIVDRMKRTF